MAGFLKTLIDDYQDRLHRQQNRPFLKAVMGACALVATADGEVDFVEWVRVDQILATLKELRVFDPHEGIDLFKEYADAILEHPEKGREAAWAALQDVSLDEEAKELMLRVCLAVSDVKGEMPLADQVEIVSLCSRLGIRPENCGLYIDDPDFPS
jgi:tellurite resistance protein